MLLVTSTATVQAQLLKDLDSLSFLESLKDVFLDRDINNYSLRVFTNYKVKRFRISNDDYVSRYVPNNKFGVGFGFASSKLLIDIAFNIKSKQKDVTHRFDMQGTTILGKKNYVNFYVQTYKGFNIKNNFEEPFVFRDDIKSKTVGFNMLHTIPDIEFSYSLLKAGLDGLDKKYYVTGGVGAFGFFDYFSADDDILDENSEDYFNEQAHIKRYNSLAVGILGGVLSVFKFTENITASCNMMPGLGVIYKHTTLNDDTLEPSSPMLFKLDYTFAVGYNAKAYYVSLIYGGGLYSTDLGHDNDYRFNLTKAKFAIGYKLGSRHRN